MVSSLGVHAGELSRRISEIDLASVRHRSDTQSEDKPHYSAQELLQLRPNVEGQDSPAIATEGVKTPPDLPVPPPSSPNAGSATPEELPEVAEAKADAPRQEESKEKKKKKKKSSGKNRKAAPTGFEGPFRYSPFK
jgi:hypothetical protein